MNVQCAVVVVHLAHISESISSHSVDVNFTSVKLSLMDKERTMRAP